MNLLEIVMLILGIIIIIISCRIVAQPDKKAKGLSLESSGIKDIYFQEELNTFKEQQNEILTYASEEAIAKTEDYLSKLSNEKIMAVSEYSDQILEKITKNHEEVVFLYNMLNHKEKELKETAKEIQNSQRKAKEIINYENEKDKEPEKDMVKPKKLDIQAENIKRQNVKVPAIEEEDNNQSTISINNTEILKLYSQGKSVLDIAKQLGIGQGEVKLVIDLFSDR
ncbi:MAG: hypothetical protein GX129_12810 [Clostridiales bacterium]|jgi:hypothetical protein|nr:hypothetical protein [Clostridiales bacterium]